MGSRRTVPRDPGGCPPSLLPTGWRMGQTEQDGIAGFPFQFNFRKAVMMSSCPQHLRNESPLSRRWRQLTNVLPARTPPKQTKIVFLGDPAQQFQKWGKPAKTRVLQTGWHSPSAWPEALLPQTSISTRPWRENQNKPQNEPQNLFP